MKKMLGVFGLCGALVCAGCDAGDVTAQNGDTVIINFAGYLDGVAFEGGTAESYPLVLGSGQFVPGFEEQLIGAKKGEERDLSITFICSRPCRQRCRIQGQGCRYSKEIS